MSGRLWGWGQQGLKLVHSPRYPLENAMIFLSSLRSEKGERENSQMKGASRGSKSEYF